MPDACRRKRACSSWSRPPRVSTSSSPVTGRCGHGFPVRRASCRTTSCSGCTRVPRSWPARRGAKGSASPASRRWPTAGRSSRPPSEGCWDLVVDGETGLVVPPRDPVALRSALERLLGRSRATAQSRCCGPGARPRALLLGRGHRRHPRRIRRSCRDNGPVKRALVTGIGGQDGSYLAELLLERGYAVAGVVKPGAAAYGNLDAVKDRIELIEADLLDQASLAARARADETPERSTTSPRPRSCPHRGISP